VEPFERSATSKARGLIGDLRHQDSFDVVQDFVEPLAPDALTASAIGNAILALLTHHDQLKWLHHGARLPDATVDELLRYDSPVQRTSRIALVDVELPEGDTIAAGDRVTVLIGAANRDYEQFVEPDQLKLDRRNASQHLTFDAQGCDPRVGPRVRLIVTMALTELFCGLPNLCLSSDPPKYASSFALRRLESLYVLNRAGHRLLH
jgi:cytochrome P450